MSFLKRIAVLFYVTMALFMGVFVVLFVLQFHFFTIDLRIILQLLATIYHDDAYRIIFGFSACGFLLLNYVFYKTLTVNSYKGRTIAFDNPSGRVNISLMAIEDLIKRAIVQTPEVREVKSKISVSKSGLRIKTTLILRAEGSIPEVTSRVQELIKKKVQEAIGLDEPIDVSIFVGKILTDQGGEKRPVKKEKEPKDPEQNIPFQGYRA